MYEPNLKLTAKLRESMAQVDEIRKLLHTIPVLPIVEENIQHESLAATIHYTAKIEGNPLDLKDVKRLGSGKIIDPNISKDQRVIMNLYRVMEFIREIAPQHNIPINEEVIKQIHAFVVRNIPEEGPPGKYKIGPNAIKDYYTGEPIFLTAEPNAVPSLMADLSILLSQPVPPFHPLILAGLAHLELVAIHPFIDGNGRTARALSDLILDRHGYNLRYLFSWVSQIGIDMSTYHLTLKQVLGDKYGANVDPTSWLEYFADSVAQSLIKDKPTLLGMRDAFVQMYNIGAEKGLTKDQVEALVYAKINGDITTGVYMQATGVSRSTAVKRLNELVKAGSLRIQGKGRNVRYVFQSLEEPTTNVQTVNGIQLGLIKEEDITST